MATHRVARKTTRKKPFWETQARAEALRIGVSETKVNQQVEAELIRLVAEKIAKEELQRLQAEKEAHPRETTARPLSDVEKTVQRKGYWSPKGD